MLSIQANNLGKKFGREWIFRDLTYTIAAGQKLVVLGSNGSGKSTFLQVLSGFVTANEGDLRYSLSGTGGEKIIPVEKIREQLAFASPYLQLIEEFTLAELIAHTRIYKRFVDDQPISGILDALELTGAKDKPVRQFSSGMKQRLKLGLAILSDTPLLLLDEPVSNLDREAIAWYKALILKHAAHRTVIVCSNAIGDEYSFCDTELTITSYKPSSPKF